MNPEIVTTLEEAKVAIKKLVVERDEAIARWNEAEEKNRKLFMEIQSHPELREKLKMHFIQESMDKIIERNKK